MLERKALSLEIKADTEGRIEGYGSVFDVLDSYGDTIRAGAFAASLQRRPRVAMLWQHNPSMPVGAWTSIAEDGNGLRVAGALAMKTEAGRNAFELASMGALGGLSIGYRVKRDEMSGDQRILHEIDLYEVSLVTMPANEAAVITGVKSIGSKDAPQVERAMREALGLSKTQARAFMARGFQGLCGLTEDEITADAEIRAWAEALRG